MTIDPELIYDIAGLVLVILVMAWVAIRYSGERKREDTDDLKILGMRGFKK